MPVSRRRKRREVPQVRSILRGTGRSERTLVVARAAQPRFIREAANWTVRNLQIGGPLRSLKPRRPADLYAGLGQGCLSLESELRWSLEIIKFNRDTILTYLQSRQKLERFLLDGDADDAIEIIDELEHSCGFSLYSVSTKVAVLQIYKGLEAQKEYLAWLKANGASRNLNFFAYWWSVRAEDSTSSRHLHKDFKRRLKRWSLEEQFRAHIAFEVLRELPSNGQEAQLLSGSYLASAVDVYEALVSICQLIVTEERESLSTILPYLTELSALTNDIRLIKLLFLVDEHADLSFIPPPNLAWRDAAVAAQPLRPEEKPSSLEELRAALTSDLGYQAQGPFQQRLGANLTELTVADRATPARDSLIKVATMLGSLGTGVWLAAVAAETETVSPKLSTTTSKMRFLGAPALEPEVASSLERGQRNALLRHLPAPKDHPYMSRQTRLATKEGGDFDYLIARLPLLELQLLEAFGKNDCDRLISLADAYEEEAGHNTLLSLNARIQGVLGRDGLASATGLAVEYLLQDAALAGWLPVTEIALALTGDERLPKPTIEVALLLDFAASIQPDPYSSERTYAIEDYLQAMGALRPTDLLRRIPRSEASQNELYFFRKVCSIAALRTSILFQNEKELEDERTAICQWLNEIPEVWSDELDDEAREIVRARLVRQGLRALEGSKLSVDRAGIQVWANRALREDYNRYIDLLRGGIFKIDDEFKQAVIQAIEGNQEQKADLAVPDNEGAALFAGVLTRAIREFGLHAEHGLDAYLSLRIRHGTISGHLRGPIEQENLITRRRSDGTYLRNEYWNEQLGGTLPPDIIVAIDDRLAELSRGYDAVIDRLTKKLVQVHSNEKPEGLIKVEVSSALVVATMVEIDPELTFDDFLTRCEDTFWAIIEAGSGAVGAAVNQLSQEVQTLFQEAEQDIRIVAFDGAGPLRDALLRGRSVAVNQLEKIRDWLRTPTTPASLSLDVEALIQVSLSVIQGFYGTFRPKLSVKVGPPIHLAHAVRWFSDVFFIIFENVLKYSGNPHDPEVTIKFAEEEEFLSFSICNSVDEPTDEQRKRIEAARQRVADGSFRTAVRSEGGTGLPKLAKVIGLGQGGGTLDFGLNESSQEFNVSFKVRKITIADGERS